MSGGRVDCICGVGLTEERKRVHTPLGVDMYTCVLTSVCTYVRTYSICVCIYIINGVHVCAACVNVSACARTRACACVCVCRPLLEADSTD